MPITIPFSPPHPLAEVREAVRLVFADPEHDHPPEELPPPVPAPVQRTRVPLPPLFNVDLERILIGEILMSPDGRDLARLAQGEGVLTGVRSVIARSMASVLRKGEPLRAEAIAHELELQGEDAAVAELLRAVEARANDLGPGVPVVVPLVLQLLRDAAQRRAEAPESPLIVTPFESVKPAQQSWLWRGWLRDNTLVSLAGDPGIGKTTLALEIAAGVSQGRPLAGDAEPRRPGNVLYISFEDDPADLQVRLAAAGADPAHVLTVSARDGGSLFPHRVTEFEDAVRQYDARLVVVDTLPAALDPGHSPGSSKVLKALQRLRQIAQENRTAILLIRHFTKSHRGGSEAHRAAGNVAILGTVRTEMHVERDPDDASVIRLTCAKSAYAKPAPLTYSIVSDEAGRSRVQWGDAPLAAQERTRNKPGPRPVKRDEATAFLRSELGEGAQRCDALVARAAEQGIAEKTLRRAKTHLRLVVNHERSGTYWELPEGAGCPEPEE